jgi:transposase
MKSDYVLGVDVSKRTLSLCLLSTNNHQVLDWKECANSTKAIRKAFDALPITSFNALKVAVEPTNNYWYPVADLAKELGCDVRTAPPGPTKLFLRSLNSRVKNDRVDAKGIALYANGMELKSYIPKPEMLSKLTDLLSLRKHLSERQAYYLSFAEAKTSCSDIAQTIHDRDKKQLEELDKRIKAFLIKLDEAKRLLKVPGFGPVTVAALLVRLLNIPFRNSDAFVAYVGLDLKVIESGQRKGKRRLTHQGDAELRRLLYLAAQSCTRAKGSPFAEIYKRYIGPEHNFPGTAAFCVVARKLARTAWSIVHYKTDYDEKRVFTKKPS